ncbi:MAG: flagellar filament capping protein FliD [Desulfobacterales bacterium]|nr:flagellar filament capping protein FliD [Desulfobacterales bacterium]
MADPITSTGTAGTFQMSGLTSDTQWADVVDQMVEVERFNINRLELWQAEWEEKLTVISGLDTLLLGLETDAEDLNTAIRFYSRLASSTDEDIVSVSTTSSAVPGAHTVTVGSNIEHRIASQGWLDKDTTAIGDAGGDFIISVGNQGTITIDDADITSATTLEDLQNLINNNAGNTGSMAVTASIIDDGSDSNQYRLVITADNGGPDYEISITGNPTLLNLYENDIAPPDISNLTATSTTAISSLGNFTGNKSDIGSAAYRTYTFTGPSSDEIIGSGSWHIEWSGDNGGGSGTIELGSDYTPGDTIEIEDGVYIRFDDGILEGGDLTFEVKAYSTNIDDAQLDDWTGTSSITMDGNYLGNTNKIFSFTVSESATVGSDDFSIIWKDTEGNYGTIDVTADNYTDLEVSQGITLSLSTGSVSIDDKFSVRATNSTIQAAVSEGLAQVEIQSHSGFIDEKTTAVTSEEGTFSYTYNGVTRSITIPAESTLTDLLIQINIDEDNPGVTASIINDGSGLNNAYHLQLTGNDTGAAYNIENISHTLDNFDMGGTTGFGFSETQAARNAMIKVNGYPVDASEYIQRSSNTVGDVIGGTTLSLQDAGTVTVTINTDNSAIIEKIHGFVDSVNSTLDYIKAMTVHIEQGSEQYDGPMQSNYTFQIIQQRINAVLSGSVPGLSDGVDTYTHLAQIGITTENAQIAIAANDLEWSTSIRRWEINDIELINALNNDVDAVANLFILNDKTEVEGIAELIRIEADTITAPYTDEDPGLLAVLTENYNNIVDNVDLKIEREERRLLLVENRLNQRFTALETLLGELSSQESALTSMLDALKQDD